MFSENKNKIIGLLRKLQNLVPRAVHTTIYKLLLNPTLILVIFFMIKPIIFLLSKVGIHSV